MSSQTTDEAAVEHAKKIVFHAVHPMHPYYTEVEMQMTLDREDENENNWLKPSIVVDLLKAERLRAEQAEQKLAEAVEDFRWRANQCRTNADAFSPEAASVWDFAADALEGRQ